MSLLLIVCTCMFATSATSQMKLNGGTFFIINKAYPHARLAQWGTHGHAVGTYEKSILRDQLWILQESNVYKGYYYIKNIANSDYRIAKSGNGDRVTGVFNGNYNNDQLWKFVPVKNGFYRIYNFRYRKARLAKWGKGDSDFGSYSLPYFKDDQLWKLEPRFKAIISNTIIWESDNRQGSKSFSQIKKVTTGLIITDSKTVREKRSFETSLTSAVEASIKFISASVGTQVKMTKEIETTLSHSTQKSWSRTVETTFTAPAGKYYRVDQITAKFVSDILADNCVFNFGFVITERS